MGLGLRIRDLCVRVEHLEVRTLRFRIFGS